MNREGSFNSLPRVFGKYYLLELINVGGMAEVFKAKMFGVEGFEKVVAIKKILPEVAEDADFIKMFIDEAKIAVQLSHPNIVQILELGKIDESFFIAMELVNGKDLKNVRKRLKKLDLLMAVEQSSHVVSQVCEGLDYAHRKTDEKMQPINIVHRDISPQNIIISYEGNVKLIDFGIAKAKSKSTKTQAGMLKGKFSYMSPEQVAGQEIDRRSDIFSLGVVLFEMLTGKRLFLGKNDVETLEKIRKAEVPAPSLFNSKVPEELDRIVLKALARDREERYQWASEFGEDLKRFLFSNSRKFSRQDNMKFMAEFFAAELDEETSKLERFRKLEVPKHLYNTSVTSHGTAVGDGTSGTGTVDGQGKGKGVLILLMILIVIVGAAAGFLIFQNMPKKSVLLVDSNVPKTIIDIDDGTMRHQRCETPCTVENITPGEHFVKLSKKGYLTTQETITIIEGKTTRKIFKMNKIGELQTIITVKSDPDGASIFVNDRDVDEETPAVLNVPVGVDITLRLEREGYYPLEQDIGKLAANKSRDISLVMKPLKNEGKRGKRRNSAAARTVQKKESVTNRGYLNINSKPWTNIYIDGTFIKATPIIGHSVEPGKHKIRFKNKKFGIDKTFPVEVGAGEKKKVIKEF